MQSDSTLTVEPPSTPIANISKANRKLHPQNRAGGSLGVLTNSQRIQKPPSPPVNIAGQDFSLNRIPPVMALGPRNGHRGISAAVKVSLGSA